MAIVSVIFASTLSTRNESVDISYSLFDTAIAPVAMTGVVAPAANSDEPALVAHTRLEEAFGQPFALLDLNTGELNRVSADGLQIDIESRLAICEEVCRRGEVEILEDCAPLLVLAVPMPNADDMPPSKIAISTFVTQHVAKANEIAFAARALGVDAEQAYRWSRSQVAWPPIAVERLGKAVVEQYAAESQLRTMKKQLSGVSQHLLQTFEELNLLHRLNEHLSLSSTEAELSELALQWLSEVLPAECLMAKFVSLQPHDDDTDDGTQSSNNWIVTGKCPLDESEYEQFFERLGPVARESTMMLDRSETSSPTWYYSDIHEVLSVPIRTTESIIGWLIAVNRKPSRQRRAGAEFGSLETSLLTSVAAILGMHSGNLELYRNQADFFESVVRALSSAIDAKDPYTRGHSERVARISVSLAKQLGCSREEINAIYLSGLLHDIGKIGIDDNVLRKPGALTEPEYEHIKQHPELGYRILQGIRQLEHVLPVVLHHHEAWDGTGYPHKLKESNIPYLARIVAVADAFDAMTSDRPYRKGMPYAKLEAVFKNGAGQQWDPEVIRAFFEVQDEIYSMVEEAREQLSLDVLAWKA